MGDYNHIQLCFFDHTRLRSREVLDALTSALMRAGFRLALLSTESEWGTDPEFGLWFAHQFNQADPDYQKLSAERKRELEQPGITPRLGQVLQDFASSKVRELDINALGVLPETAPLDFYLLILSDIEETNAGVLDSVLSFNEDFPTYWFEYLPVLLYNALHPDFVYLHTEGDYYIFTSSSLQKGESPCLYVNNYFGPLLVQKIGREQLMTAPGASVRELSDGGLFVKIEQDINAACKHLGLIWNTQAR